MTLRQRLQNTQTGAQAARAQKIDVRDEQGQRLLAKRIIEALPARLKEAAEGRLSGLDVMPLDDYHHYDRQLNESTQALVNYIELNGFSLALFFGAAKSVIDWLLAPEQNLTVKIELRPQSDESQGRAWDKAFIVAYWD